MKCEMKSKFPKLESVLFLNRERKIIYFKFRYWEKTLSFQKQFYLKTLLLNCEKALDHNKSVFKDTLALVL